MPRYPRTVIPGRPSDGRDLDRLVFGDGEDSYDALPEDAAAEEEEYEGAYEDDDADIGFVERSRSDRRRRSRGRRREDFAELPGGDGAYGEQTSNARGMVLLCGMVVICGVFGAVVWNAYRGGIRPAEASPAPMLSASGPIKTRPVRDEEPVRSAMNAGVFDRMEAEPVVREPEVEDLPKPVEVVRAEPAPEPEAAPEPAPEPEPEPVEIEAPTPMPEPEAVRASPVVTPEPVGAPTPLRAPIAAEPEPEPAQGAQLSGAFAPKFVTGAAHLVQIGATDSIASADEEYARRARQAPDLFAGAERVVVPVQVNGKQMYRVRVGSFASAEDANAFCSAYKARVGDCYRATR